jgi:hypothetical protein
MSHIFVLHVCNVNMCRVFVCDSIHEVSLYKPELPLQTGEPIVKPKDFVGTWRALLSQFLFPFPAHLPYILKNVYIYIYIYTHTHTHTHTHTYLTAHRLYMNYCYHQITLWQTFLQNPGAVQSVHWIFIIGTMMWRIRDIRQNILQSFFETASSSSLWHTSTFYSLSHSSTSLL